MRRAELRSDVWFSILLAVAFLVVAYALSLGLSAVVPSAHGWVYSGDLFATLRDAHMILWGGYGILYSSGNGLIAPPLGALSLVPLAELSSLLGLVEPYPQPFADPIIWLYALGYMGIFAFVWALAAKRLLGVIAPGMSHSKVVVASSLAVAGYVLFPWGHPEDLAAVALCFFAFNAFSRQSFAVGAYLAGFAVGFQPLALLFLIPMFLICLPGFKPLGAAVARAALVPAVLLAPAFVASPTQSLQAVLHQPNFPTVDHLTIWGVVLGSHGKVFAAGEMRLAMVLAVLVASIVARRVHARRAFRPQQIVILCALGLSLRAFFEPVIVAYYLAPFLATVVLFTPRNGQKPALLAGGLATFGLGIIGTASIHTAAITYSVDLWALNLGMVTLMAVSFCLAGKDDNNDLAISAAVLGSNQEVSSAIVLPKDVPAQHEAPVAVTHRMPDAHLESASEGPLR